jgi:hypothetical protein
MLTETFLILTRYNKKMYTGFHGSYWLFLNLIFCLPCIIVHQYNEANVMHILFSLLRINGLYMYRALLAHRQEALHRQQLAYCVHVMSVGCTRVKVER